MRDLFRSCIPRAGGGRDGFSIIGMLLVFMVLTFLLTGCITTQKQLCPSENIVYFIETPFGPMPVVIEKDFCSEKNKDEKWITEKEYDQIMEKRVTPDDNKGEADPIEHNIPFTLEL